MGADVIREAASAPDSAYLKLVEGLMSHPNNSARPERLKLRDEQTAAPAPLILSGIERADLEAFVGALDRAEIEQSLDSDDILEFKAELETARAQAKSPRPKRHIVCAAVARLIEFTVKTGANVAATVIAKAAGL